MLSLISPLLAFFRRIEAVCEIGTRGNPNNRATVAIVVNCIAICIDQTAVICGNRLPHFLPECPTHRCLLSLGKGLQDENQISQHSVLDDDRDIVAVYVAFINNVLRNVSFLRTNKAGTFCGDTTTDRYRA